MENLIEMDDLGGKPTIFGNSHLFQNANPLPVLGDGRRFFTFCHRCECNVVDTKTPGACLEFNLRHLVKIYGIGGVFNPKTGNW